MKKIGIIGKGFVGTAVDYGFNKDVTKFIVDPRLGTSINELKYFDPEFIFICVPTPMNDDGTQDDTIITSVFNEISSLFSNTTLIIKSTVLPDSLTKLSMIYTKCVYNPEFLREKTAKEDFIKSENLILGGMNSDVENVASLYANHTECTIKNVYKTDLISASLVKYSINTFLASKVIFFNQLFSIFENSNSKESWENFIQMVASDSRIGDSHMSVPGHDGRLGFGGACFPKDTSALLKLSNKLESEFTLLKEVIRVNNNIRVKYSNLEKREKEQGVNFKIDLE
ncbi:hypothetical protein N8448_02865 [Gammaproteobacteria bacterium]|nr:hypothetical protein [Gammaproteobacteria bacterium]